MQETNKSSTLIIGIILGILILGGVFLYMNMDTKNAAPEKALDVNVTIPTQTQPEPAQ